MKLSRGTQILLTALMVMLVVTGGLWRAVERRQNSDSARARAVVSRFMEARLTRNDTVVRPFLTIGFHQRYVNQPQATLIGGADPHYQRFRIVNMKEIGHGAWQATVRVEEDMRGFSPAGWFQEYISVVRVDGVYRIDAVKTGQYHAYNGTVP